MSLPRLEGREGMMRTKMARDKNKAGQKKEQDAVACGLRVVKAHDCRP